MARLSNSVFVFLRFLVLLSILPSTCRADCLDRQAVDLIAKDLEFYQGQKPLNLKKLDLCGTGHSLAFKTIAALLFLKRHSELPRLSQAAEAPILGPNTWDYFTERIQQIQFADDGEGLCGQDNDTLSVVAYYEPQDRTPTMHICKAFRALDLLTGAPILVHEAQHSEGYQHVDCTRGPLKGETVACDETYQLRGSYATEVEYKIRIAKHKDVDPILRRSSRIAAVTDLFERFNDEPMGLDEVALVQGEDGSVYAHSARGLEQVGLGTPTQVMVDREGEPILFDSVSGSVKTYALGQITDTDGWLAARFREIAKGRTDFKDALFSADSHCLLFQSELLCGPSQGPRLNFRLRFSRLSPVGFIYRSEKGLLKELTVYLVGDDGRLYRLPSSHAELMRLKESTLKGVRFAQPLLKISASSGSEPGEYVLTRDGRFFLSRELSDGRRSFEGITLPPGLRLKSIVSPVIWSKDLRAL